MAQVLFLKHLKASSDLMGCPYVVTEEGYPDAINYFIQDRWSGLVSSDGREDLDDARLIGQHAILALAGNLANFLSWTEFEPAHPSTSKLHWKDVKPYHIKHIYKQHMVAGYWSQEFFASGTRAPLSPGSTINPRIRDNSACWRFMSRNGLIEPWDEKEIDGRANAELRESIAVLERLTPNGGTDEQSVRKYSVRPNPRSLVLPTIDDLRAVFAELSPTPRCGFRMILSRGLRLQEVIENTLLPGELCQRSKHFLKLAKPAFPTHPYILRYDRFNDQMIGVLPPAESVFGVTTVESQTYRILGKGPKIREIELFAGLLRHIWRYAANNRPTYAAKSKKSYPNLLLDRFGRPYSKTALSRALLQACRRASTKAGRTIKITAHLLRHAFACFFLEAAILGKAKEEGLDPDRLTSAEIDSFAEGPVLIVKEDMGHVFLETTHRYLTQLKTGRLGFQYHKLWNEFLDKEGF